MSASENEPLPDEPNYPKQIRNALRGLLFIAVIVAMYFARDFLLPVVLAFFLALTLRPAIRYLAKQGIPPALAAASFVLTLVAGGISMIYLLSGPVSSWIDQAPQLQQTFSEKFSGWRSSLDAVINLSEKLQVASVPASPAAVQEVVVRASPLPGLLVMLTGYPIQILITLIATLVIAVFLLASGDLFYEKLVRILPTLTQRKRALHIVYDIENEVSVYVLTLTAINAGLGLIIAVTFHLLGMPMAPLWGLLIFFFNFIPYVGAVAGVALSGFMAIIAFDSLSYALLVPLAYILWSLAESEIVKPQILGRRLQMNAVAILLALAFFTWLWDIAGAAIAVPLLVTIKVFCDHLDGLSGLGEFIAVRQADKEAADSHEKLTS
jgi:predicted PurR-regulated permease PerM